MGDRRKKYGASPDMQACPVETTLDVIGGKWKGIILYQLLNGTKRFNEFRRLNPGITQFMLTLQLRELERDGIIHREIYKEVPPRVEYSLTDFGRTLEPVIMSMKVWGESYKVRLNENPAIQEEESERQVEQ
ncbi:helix-turn-helix transcriptional regulator [Brevibacillus sp. M2.1A]|uniref:winged helix-turn-helix transcriptional regulator n=1 Tax=Brevibacillus TaxID=55080 RepID=UPI00156BB7A9|nr:MULTISPECIES: helix-turn-helix domain-containing protein [Brevibacillus]MBY0087740.1 helix-turn-helix transcriptional regulator [Brevibacillus brevis]MCC8433433.1 helix-turn-helix transcriptional regulator [Brevibacillus sp. M2.1A]MCE0450688.1 helix-turn-helix transcriptional regulator [Brevibacillus sp. AF8]UKL01147.1 helix-turn-helix transcriptional regulator [Brevibacillus brevis]